MSNTMQVTIRRTDDRTRFETQVDDNPPLVMDGHKPFGNDGGYTALDLFLISLADCISLTLVTLMQDRMRRTVSGMETTATGVLRDGHPRIFTRITVQIDIASPDATEAEIERALDSVENKLCPISAMIKGNVEVEVRTCIHNLFKRTEESAMIT